jgi:hypothetical protein
LTKKKNIIEKDDEMIVSKVCAKQGVCAKCRTSGSAVCLTCTEYQQMIQYDERYLKMRKLIKKMEFIEKDLAD